MYVDFNVEEPEPWHEFLVGSAIDIERGIYCLKSPDDEFVMELRLGEDVRGLRLGASRYRLPAGLGAALGSPVYRFNNKVTAPELAAFLRRCPGLESEWRRDLLGDGAVVASEDAAVPAAQPEPRGPPAPHGRDGGASPRVADSTEALCQRPGKEWVAVFGDADAGTLFPSSTLKGVDQKVGIGDWMIIKDGEAVTVVGCADAGGGDGLVSSVAAALSYKDRGHTPRGEDARILAIERNQSQKRYMTFGSQVLRMKREEFSLADWGLVGPRSAPHYLFEISKTGMGAITRSTAWKHENHVQDDSHVGQMHELIAEALEHFACIDQIDCFNSTGVETLVRTAQYLEYDVKKKREAKIGADGQHYFRARQRATGGAVIDPELISWISSSAGADAKVLREQRCAAEETAAGRKEKGK